MSSPHKMPTPDLAGLLTARRPAAPRPTLGEEAPAAVASDRPAVRETVVAARSAARGTADVVADDSQSEDAGPPVEDTTDLATSDRVYRRSITVYLPRNLHRRVGVAAAASGTTRTAVMLDAINRTHSQLGSALQEPVPSSGQDLFAVPQARSAPAPSVQTTLRVTDEQYAALEGLTRKHAVNRSRIMTTALVLVLGETATHTG